jgi:uncharacterized membrane protein
MELTEAGAPPGISLSTPYPSVDTPSGTDNEFKVDVKNIGGEDRVIDFYALHPQGWGVTFKPRYEDKLIRSLDFKADESKSLTVTVTPPPNVEPGVFSIFVVAESGDFSEQLELKLNIVGTYALELSTPDGLLSFDAVQGREAPVTLSLFNSGTADLENVRFSSSKPVGWEVVFKPDGIPSVGPDTAREVSVSVKPPSDAIPGDYTVTLRATADPYQTGDRLNFRVTVRGSMSWGIVGAGIIAVVAVGLIGMFWWLGRR